MQLVLIVFTCVTASVLHITNGEQKFTPIITEGPYQNYSALPLVELGGRQYFFDTSKYSTWTEAGQICRTLGMLLVSVQTEEENNLIKTHIETNTGISQYWMSGTDFGRNEGDYIWDSTGEKVIFTDFGVGEPNHWPGEHYLQFTYVSSTGLLYWNDNDDLGQNLTYLICEEI